MMQGDQNLTAELVIGECVVGAGGIPVPVDEGVVPHILIAEAPRFQDRTGCTLELNPLPATF